jgi:hypothetical protein
MMSVGYRMMRPLFEAAVDSGLGFAGMPLPRDAPSVHASGPDADRLVLIGTGAVAGNGVVSHQVGLGGHLARRISSLTGRGVDLELDGAMTRTVEEAQERLNHHELAEYDAVLFFIGSREAIGFQPMRIWKRAMVTLLRETANRGARQIFVIGVPPIGHYSRIPRGLRDRMRRQVRRMNSVLASVVPGFPGAHLVPFAVPPAGAAAIRVGTSAAYEQWAQMFAPAIAPELTRRGSRPLVPVDERARQQALDELHVIGSDADQRFDRIARAARDLLGASGASVTFLDHDRQWIKSAIEMSHDDTARASSFCNTTISRPELFVVEDASRDDAFAGHPWVVGQDHVRFYAGYPVEAPNGQRVGALCVVDTKPRRFSRSEAALLRELALRVQELLWAGGGDRPTLAG